MSKENVKSIGKGTEMGFEAMKNLRNKSMKNEAAETRNRKLQR